MGRPSHCSASQAVPGVLIYAAETAEETETQAWPCGMKQ